MAITRLILVLYFIKFFLSQGHKLDRQFRNVINLHAKFIVLEVRFDSIWEFLKDSVVKIWLFFE